MMLMVVLMLGMFMDDADGGNDADGGDSRH